jgi:hypothetical protein
VVGVELAVRIPDARSSAFQLREFFARNISPGQLYEREWRGGGRALLLVLFRLRFFLFAVASHLAFCHVVLPFVAADT